MNHIRMGRRLPATQPYQMESHRVVLSEQVELILNSSASPAQGVRLQARTWHILILVQSQAHCKMGEELSLDLEEGETLLLSPGKTLELDFLNASQPQPVVLLEVQLGEEALQYFWEQFGPPFSISDLLSEDALYLKLGPVEAIRPLMEQFVEGFTLQPPFQGMVLEETIHDLLEHLFRGYQPSSPSQQANFSCNNPQLNSVLQYIDTNLEERLSVTELASAAHMSRATFFRYFLQEFGTTPLHFVNCRRIFKAKELLQDSKLSVTDVCYMVGFRSVSHFIKLFKAELNSTPKQYQMVVQRESTMEEYD